jgi:Arc/MetJ-type ribon-helix-helix transcriptional regulator
MAAPMDQITIRLSSDLRQEIERRIRDTEFESLDEYVQFVLQEIVDEDIEPAAHDERVDEEQLEDRLKDLGYL